MFRRLEKTMGPDPTYEANWEKLGYFVDNSAAACIRNIKAPELFFDFHYTNNDRHNEVRGEAMRELQREGVLERLSALGLNKLYLPTLSNTKPDGPHIPILLPPAEVLKTRKRIVVLINDDHYQDLGILSYRQLQRDGGLNGGSIVNFVKKLVARNHPDIAADGTGVESNEDIPGLIIMNTSQSLYSHKFNKALSMRSWNALPRASIYHDAIMIHETENQVEGHRTPEEHVKTVFDSVIMNPDFVASDAEVYVLGIEGGSAYIMNILNQDFWKYGHRITAMAIFNTQMQPIQITEPALKAFLHARTRHWKAGTQPCIDPLELVDLPQDYNPSPSSPSSELNAVNWLEKASGQHVDHFADARQRFDRSTFSKIALSDESLAFTATSGFYADEALCPTFAGGDTDAGERIFTQPKVQDAVLKFFENVAQSPQTYNNPPWDLAIPQPTPSSPLMLDPTDSLPLKVTEDMLSEDQQAIDAAQAALTSMEVALSSTPSTATFQDSRQRLEQRIVKKKAEVEDMEKKALATGGLGAGAAKSLRETWEKQPKGERWTPTKIGPNITFAGVEADSEIVKGAGCVDTVAEELKRLELEEE